MIPALEKFGKVRRNLNLTFSKLLKPLGIGTKQAIMLRHLSQHRKSSLADLSRATITDPASVGRSVDLLIRRGVIKKREHDTDNRRWEISLTASGLELAQKVEQVYAQLAGQMTATLSAPEKKVLVTLFDKMAEALHHPVKNKLKEKRS